MGEGFLEEVATHWFLKEYKDDEDDKEEEGRKKKGGEEKAGHVLEDSTE